jgi:hypothetical protein
MVGIPQTILNAACVRIPLGLGSQRQAGHHVEQQFLVLVPKNKLLLGDIVALH